jgi:concanavalin A-like lectin/glucanase superfamily protein
VTILKFRTSLFIFCLLSLAVSSSATWYDSDFKYKQQITIQNGQVAGNETDFSVLITQADVDSAFWGNVEKATISNMDIIFTNAAEDTKLSREIVHFASGAQELEAWVETDLSGSTDTVIYMYYGNSAASEPNDTGTWSNSFAGVWHLQSSAGGANDVAGSTLIPNHGTSQNMSSADEVAGKISNALDFNGNDEYVNCGNDSSLDITGNLTLSAWIRMSTTENMAMRIISKKDDSADTDGYGWARNRNLGAGGMYFYGIYSSDYSSADLTLDTNWHYAVAVITGNTTAFYIDGSAITMLDSGVANRLTGTHDLFIANQDTGNTKCFDGEIDEARVSNTDRSANWISTSYNNQNNPGNFYNVGSEVDYTANRYRSVGYNNTTALQNGGSNALTISGDNAVFASVDIANNVGVGDAIQYDSDDGDAAIDAIAFIHARVNARTFRIRSADGSYPIATTGNQVWNIYRAYTTLADADEGTENIGINATVRPFDAGNRDTVTNNEIWHFACYNDATYAGTVTWNGWTTDATHYIRFFTPRLSTEVGTSQRHSGIWTTGAFHWIVSNAAAFSIQDANIRLEGLQMYVDSVNGNNQRVIHVEGGGVVSDYRVSHCILRGTNAGTNGSHHGIRFASNGSGTLRLWNCVIYGFQGTNNATCILINDVSYTYYIYNTTVGIAQYGVRVLAGTTIAKNVIAQSCTDGFEGTFDGTSVTNISDIASDAPGAITSAIDVTFEDEVTPPYDLHLADSESFARTSGTNLTLDAFLGITDDIDYESRTVTWCIGADENDSPLPIPTATPTTVINSPTVSPTATHTPSFTHSPTTTDTPTETPTFTVTHTVTITPTTTSTPSITVTSTITQTLTVTPPWTHTVTPTVTPTSTYSPTATITHTYTITRTSTVTTTVTPTPTITVTLTITVTSTVSPTPTNTLEYIVPNDLDNVVIYPNPYRSDIKPEKEVSFDRVPAQATIRLYDISGQLIKTIKKDSQVPWVRWDLKNESGSHVASGVYIYIIRANGQERRGKIAILQ